MSLPAILTQFECLIITYLVIDYHWIELETYRNLKTSLPYIVTFVFVSSDYDENSNENLQSMAKL